MRIVADVDTLAYDLVLLSLSPGSGRIRTAQKIGYGLMGSELVRLAASGRIDIEAGRIVIRSADPTGDAELDAALASIERARRPPMAERWVGRPRRGISGSYLERLAASGFVRKEGRVLTRWRIADPGRVADARSRLDAIAAPDAPLDLAQAALGGLAHAIGLDAMLYRGWGNRGIRKRFKQIADGQWTAAAVRRAGDAAELTTVDPFGAPGSEGTSRLAGHSSDQAATHAASEAGVHSATQAATHAAAQAATHAAAQAAVHAATQAAVHAATQAAVHAAVEAAHSASDGGGHGGHGGH